MKSVFTPSEKPEQTELGNLRYPSYTNGTMIGWLLSLAMHIIGIYLMSQFESPLYKEFLLFGLVLWIASFIAGPKIGKRINIGAQNQRIEENFKIFEELGFTKETVDYSDARRAQHFFGMAIDTEKCVVHIVENSKRYTYEFKDIDNIGMDHKTSSYTTKVKTGTSSRTTYSSKGIHFSDTDHYKNVTSYTDSHYRLLIKLNHDQTDIFNLTYGGFHDGTSAKEIVKKLQKSVYAYQHKFNVERKKVPHEDFLKYLYLF